MIDVETGSLFTYPSRGFDDLPPPDCDMLLHPIFRLISFPGYFESLHRYLIHYNNLCVEQRSLQLVNETSRIESEKVSLLAQYLTRMSSVLGPDGLNLVIPYVIEQLTDLQANAAQSAWLLFYPVSQAIGPSDSGKHFLQPLVAVFDTDETSVKYLKIYHRSFVSQLVVRLGLDVFLSAFSTLLVEAAAGYKDFASSASDQVAADAAVSTIDLQRSSDDAKMSDFELEMTAVNGEFENDAGSDIDVAISRSEYVLTSSADEDDAVSAASASGVIEDSSREDKTPDGDTSSNLSESVKATDDTASSVGSRPLTK